MPTQAKTVSPKIIAIGLALSVAVAISIYFAVSMPAGYHTENVSDGAIDGTTTVKTGQDIPAPPTEPSSDVTATPVIVPPYSPPILSTTVTVDETAGVPVVVRFSSAGRTYVMSVIGFAEANSVEFQFQLLIIRSSVSATITGYDSNNNMLFSGQVPTTTQPVIFAVNFFGNFDHYQILYHNSGSMTLGWMFLAQVW